MKDVKESHASLVSFVPRKLRYVFNKIVPPSECHSSLQITDAMFCGQPYNEDKREDACQGDSGGNWQLQLVLVRWTNLKSSQDPL